MGSTLDTHKKAKVELQKRLDSLNEKLNEYLASTYGIDKERQEKKYTEWLESHQPFHWLAEFYEIINGNGGFDVVIGNPPYVRYGTSFEGKNYTVLNHDTISCNNLHALVVERCFRVISDTSYTGYIVPLPSINTSAMEPLQQIIKPSANNQKDVWISCYDERPSSLFEGVDQRLIIEIIRNTSVDNSLFSTKINRWNRDCRNHIFQNLSYNINRNSVKNLGKSILKISNEKVETGILSKLYANKTINHYISPTSSHEVYYRTAGGRYWKTFLNQPFGTRTVSEKSNSFKISEYAIIAILSSDVFWYYYS